MRRPVALPKKTGAPAAGESDLLSAPVANESTGNDEGDSDGGSPHCLVAAFLLPIGAEDVAELDAAFGRSLQPVPGKKTVGTAARDRYTGGEAIHLHGNYQKGCSCQEEADRQHRDSGLRCATNLPRPPYHP